MIADVVAGNPERAAAFCQRVWRPVDRAVRRLLGHDDSDYEDLVQLSIIELIRSISNYRNEGSLDAWVSGVTAHMVYRHIRRRGIDRLVSIDQVQEDLLHSGQTTGEEALADRQSVARVVQHLDRLGEKLAWAFILHDVHGYGLRDVARIMGTSEAAAQSRLVRGRRRLHQLIAADPELADVRDRWPRNDDDDNDDDDDTGAERDE
ncbi:MAG TPA: sigma-70 family RNA polymerase sigma factor [Polyangia bacterium]|nr:sigma-70 family RNA polymerase sigma factor [Polyangia bacterium]